MENKSRLFIYLILPLFVLQSAHSYESPLEYRKNNIFSETDSDEVVYYPNGVTHTRKANHKVYYSSDNLPYIFSGAQQAPLLEYYGSNINIPIDSDDAEARAYAQLRGRKAFDRLLNSPEYIIPRVNNSYGSSTQSSHSSGATEESSVNADDSFGDTPTAKAMQRLNEKSKKDWRYTGNSFAEIPQDSEELSDTAKQVENTRKKSFTASIKDPRDFLLKSAENNYDYLKEPIADYQKRMKNKMEYSFTQDHLNKLSELDKQKVEKEAEQQKSSSKNIPTNTSTNNTESKISQQWDIKTALKKDPSAPRSCKTVHKTNRRILFENDHERELAQRCLDNPEDRSFQCVHFISKVAVTAFSTEPACEKLVSTRQLMCIFSREAGKKYDNKDSFKCSVNGCGLAQFTSSGTKAVVRSFSNTYDLGYGYDSFWEMIGLPQKKENKCNLTRRDANDRNTSIIMAATLLCAQAKHNPKASSQNMSCQYNEGYNECSRKGNNTSYTREVSSCEKDSQWELIANELIVSNRASCLLTQSCPLKESLSLVGSEKDFPKQPSGQNL